MTTQMRAAVLNNYSELCRHLGLNPQLLLGEVGLTPALLADQDNRISATAVVSLLEKSAQASNCLTFGLRLAETRQLSDFGAVSLLLLHQKTLRDALHITIHYRRLLNEALVMHIEDAGKVAIIREEVVTETSVPARQSIEFAIGVLYRLCKALLGGNWHPQSVNFTHDAPQDVQLHKRMFGAKVEFGAEFNGIVCASADLDCPNPQADPAMARYAELLLSSLQREEALSVAEEVRQAIYLLLPMGRASIEQIAQAMGVNTRTLQRRLESDGVTFTDLINEVRFVLVQRYMANPQYSLSCIADLLGYSMASSFTRWFNAQFGMSPVRWRSINCPSSKGE
ncbi:AraC family transcriptional regulator [Aestuariicella hydrocarbonica]|uniref:AraC family transcriptional regulator n=1 Tax=Pseudomaricurvus hydrocarbonicus TaxID=1470433 RepID=A0A9E5MLX4_9GAMM|nr:AraC family transcriptional regulator [Aestuariicella hydrocarbonica]NHO65723.1 AraC family transcriptional regulator [Aestuariicella hydrocarbonica]